MSLKNARRIPRATYRVQLHAAFGFAELAAILPYLRQLGISDIYSSPIFSAAPGSTHGYDVSDYRHINPELGGEDGFRALATALREHDLGLILDFVPNHMGIKGPFNAWWRDVLEFGQRSRYAQFFDIHWNTHRGSERVLVPILEGHYGVVLEKGNLSLVCDNGVFSVKVGETRLPIRPESYAQLLRDAGNKISSEEQGRALRALAESFDELKENDAGAMARSLTSQLGELLGTNEAASDAVKTLFGEINGRPGEPRSFDALDHLLNEQHYRLARWKTGAHEINYRRFFAIDTLVGMRMERDEVFAESHHRLAELIRDGSVTGLRIDHIDGLWDPERYLGQLHELTTRGEEAPLYTLVEKIVEGDERLPARWLTHGTTGYEFAADVAQLLTDSRSAKRFEAIYAQFVGHAQAMHEVIYQSKRLILDEMFANAVNNLGQQLDDLFGEDRNLKDLTRQELTVAIRETIAQLDIYRTYRRPGDAVTPEDVAAIERAVKAAKSKNSRLDPEAFDALRDLLTAVYPREDQLPDFRSRALAWLMTFQQYTGAIMAKAVEDTAFYRHNLLIALNEVGGNPASFGSTVERFHEACRVRAENSPLTQLTTSTHDTKLSEDARARLLVLSEMPEEWEAWLKEWRQINAAHKTQVGDRIAPDADEEYRFYQALLASWPVSGEIDESFRKRLRENLRKATSEAKRNTTWSHPNEVWLTAGDRFVDAVLSDEKSNAFLQNFGVVARRIARLGVINSLVQTTLKLTTPGVPDFYQGNELLDFSLVDPDNRRPVDYFRAQELAVATAERSWYDLLATWDNGAIKQRVTKNLLHFREQHAELFSRGSYAPAPVTGRFSNHAVAFFRRTERAQIAVILPRLTAKLGCPPLGLVWDDTGVSLGRAGETWVDILTGTAFVAAESTLLADIFAKLPLAVLHRTQDGTTDNPGEGS